MKKSKTMEKDDVLQTAVLDFLCHLNTGLGLVVEFMSCSVLSFPLSLQSQPKACLASSLGSLSSPPRTELQLELCKDIVDFRHGSPFWSE